MKANNSVVPIGATLRTTTNKVEKLKSLRDAIKLLKAEEAGLIGDIKDFIGDDDVLISSDGVELVTYKESTSYRLDTKLLKADHPEIYTECSFETTARRFLVK